MKIQDKFKDVDFSYITWWIIINFSLLPLIFVAWGDKYFTWLIIFFWLILNIVNIQGHDSINVKYDIDKTQNNYKLKKIMDNDLDKE